MSITRSALIPLGKVLHAVNTAAPQQIAVITPPPATTPEVLAEQDSFTTADLPVSAKSQPDYASRILVPENTALPEYANRAATGEVNNGFLDYENESFFLYHLTELEAPALNAALQRADLPHLLSPWMDGWLSHSNRIALIDCLTRDRLADLDIPTRVAIITALQFGETDALSEEAICRIFLGTTGRDLTRLKNAIDGGNNEYDLHKLLYSDIDNIHIRKTILQHIAREGHANPTGQLKILSDIDDTFLRWRDKRFPSKVVYPGVLTFYEEMDRGTGNAPDLLADLVFISARPGDFLGLVEAWTLDTLLANGIKHATLLTGSLSSVLGSGRIAKQKFRNFVEYKALYPEYRFFFVGDSGQEDAIFAELSRQTFPDEMPLALIHNVNNSDPMLQSAYAAAGVPFFDTYVGAARLALGAGLMLPAGAVRVAESAVRDFTQLRFNSEDQKEFARYQLTRDIRALTQMAGVTLTASLKTFLAASPA